MGYAAVENHYGDNYVARVDSEQDIEDIMQTCEICFDSDWVIRVYDTEEEAKEHIYDSIL
ncbi:hypothetical protein [Weissella confusa]|uniref:hypothetical protein n=1 Tax=Weissella confusa TaxID=1583 RepID=UPI0018F1A4EA|nr:hypothetical protein [Weissella confusa]MBJ7626929.1 hypothetical protein [Weissella confusa]MCS9993527.1 hypothetical protein [Weissella confusa]